MCLHAERSLSDCRDWKNFIVDGLANGHYSKLPFDLSRFIFSASDRSATVNHPLGLTAPAGGIAT
jgi:hypothetical protein